MTRLIQQEALKGSQKWLQVSVNEHPQILDDSLRPLLNLASQDSINWLSPERIDAYAEYRDQDFLQLLSIQLQHRSLDSFWPHGGPVWDGLANTSRGDIILVEAKSHISELASSCQASKPSLDLIQRSLSETARFYNSTSPENWTDGYYQYANRLAHLYLLRELNGIPAWLVFVYFVNDLEMAGPKSIAEWQSTIRDVHKHLGIEPMRLRPYVVDVFMDVAMGWTNMH